MRIVLLSPQPPPTEARYLWNMLVSVLLGYVVAVILMQISLLNILLRLLYEITAPFVDILLKLAGVLRVDNAVYNGVLTVFLFFLVRGLVSLAGYTRLVIFSIEYLDTSIGYIKRRVHGKWLAGSAFLLLLAALTNLWPPLIVPDPPTRVVVDCSRILFVVGGCAGCLATLMIGLDLRQSWLRGGAQSPDAPQTPRIRKKPVLRVIETPKPVKSENAVNPVYLALAAELVQACGRTGAPPTVEGLTTTLGMLQKAARLTRADTSPDGDLAGLSRRTLELFTSGQLKTLPDLKAAKRLYDRKGAGVLNPVAAELAAKLTLN